LRHIKDYNSASPLLQLRFSSNWAARVVTDPRPSPGGVHYVEVGVESEGQRLDNFLIARLKGVPRTHIYRLLRKGEVRVNKGRARPDYRVKAGDSVRIPPVRMGTAATVADPEVLATRFGWLEQRVLFEDEHLLVLDKPAGLAVHGGSGQSVGLIEALRGLRPHSPYLELAHRLDKETSGCLLIAKSRPALLALHEALRGGEMTKTYLALVQGDFRGRNVMVDAALDRAKHGGGERRVQVVDDEEGKESASRFSAMRHFAQGTLVEITLFTGRTHQARVHAAHLGHAIAGDDKYGDHGFNRDLRAFGLKRLFLHAARLELRHPRSGAPLRFEAPLAEDLATLLSRLQ